MYGMMPFPQQDDPSAPAPNPNDASQQQQAQFQMLMSNLLGNLGKVGETSGVASGNSNAGAGAGILAQVLKALI